MWEKQMPAGTVIPNDNFDWCAKIVDECLVGTWAQAKLKIPHPVLQKLVDIGQEEINIVIRAADFRHNVILGEYIDIDTLQLHLIWFPVNHLYNVEIPLTKQAASLSTVDVEESVQNMNSLLAKNTLLKCFQNQSKLKDILDWAVSQTYDNSPITGWLEDLECVLPLEDPSESQVFKRSISKIELSGFVEDCIDKINTEAIQDGESK